MQEKTRTKVLAGVLGSTLLFSWARPDKMITEPLQKADADWTTALEKKDQIERKEAELLKAKFKLNTWKGQSLPPNAETAKRVYRTWVNDLAEECNLSRLVVEAGSTLRKSTRKGDVYRAVQVKLEGEGTLAELSQFLYRFKKTDLLQRIRDLNIESEDTEGDPYMTINMVAEGICMNSADERSDLFIQSAAAAEVTDDATELKVADAEKFPSKPGFQVKVGDSGSGYEYMEVTEIAEDGSFKVERGLAGSEAKSHDPKAKIQMVPIAQDMADTSFDDEYKGFLEANPFVKPKEIKPFEPKIVTIGKKKLTLGDELEFKVSVINYDPALGEPVFKLAEGHPEGMAIDEESGEVTWEPEDDAELKEYEAKVLVTQADKNLEKGFTVALNVENNDPEITVPRNQIAAWLGQQVIVDLKVKDETPEDRLKFEIEGVDGAYVDSETLQLNWRPAEDIEPGEYRATVKVTDAGGKTAEGVIRFLARDDAARYTKFTGAVALDAKMSAYLFDQINNRKTKVSVGSDLQVADIVGKIKSIESRSLVLATNDGDMTVKLGDDLRTVAEEMAKELKENPPKAEEPVEAPKDDEPTAKEEGEDEDKSGDAKDEDEPETKDEPQAKEDEEGKAKDKEEAAK